jgi:hypothetical protein
VASRVVPSSIDSYMKIFFLMCLILNVNESVDNYVKKSSPDKQS